MLLPKFDDFFIQEFSVPKPIINHILDILNGKFLRKLHKSCKYFCVKMPYAVLDSFLIAEGCKKRNIYEYDADFPLNDPLINSAGKKLWIINELHLADITNMPKFISKIVRCDISYLTIQCLITIDELKFLTKSGNVDIIALYYPEKAYFPKNSLLLPEDIVALVPKATEILIFQFSVTKNTMEKLLKHEHQVKMVQVLWHGIDEIIETKLICKFLEKNLALKAHANIRFKEENQNPIFKAESSEIFRSWTPKEKIPTISTASRDRPEIT